MAIKRSDFGQRSHPIKVLYIAGPTRSGSTIISNILGQIDGFFHAGEVIEAWDRGRIWKCSCGEFPDVCTVWSKIFHELDRRISDSERRQVIGFRDRWCKSHKVILQHLLQSGRTAKIGQSLDLFTRRLYRLYATIQQKTGARVIIDSSKNAGYGYLLSQIAAIDLYIVHLVRDSRAVVFSWSRQKRGLWTESLFKVAATWNSRNIATELIKRQLSGRYIQVLYEEFMTEPMQMTQKIVAPFHVSDRCLPFISSHQVCLKTSHGLCGNPGRFGKGIIQLTPDTRWHQLKPRKRVLATALTWPLLLRYNYPR